MRLLAKEPQARPPSARVVREQLERLRADEGHTAPWRTPVTPSPENEKPEEPSHASPPRRWPKALAGLALGLALLALGWVLLRGDQGADSWRVSLLAEPTVPVLASAPREQGAPPVPSPHNTPPLPDSALSSQEPSPLCRLLRGVLGSLALAQLAGCATTPPPVRPDPFGYLARCSTEARITPRTLGFQPQLHKGPDPYTYATFLETGTPASSQPIVDGGPLNVRSGPILAIMYPLIDGKEDKEFLVAGEAFVTPERVYIQIDRIQLPDGSWLPLCGVAYAGEDKESSGQFGVPTYAVEPLAVTPLDPALVDSRPGSVVLNDPRFETFVQPAQERVRPSFLRMPPERR
jgi:serine/threonine-protein kinase